LFSACAKASSEPSVDAVPFFVFAQTALGAAAWEQDAHKEINAKAVERFSQLQEQSSKTTIP
jgi:hypothetical protein